MLCHFFNPLRNSWLCSFLPGCLTSPAALAILAAFLRFAIVPSESTNSCLPFLPVWVMMSSWLSLTDLALSTLPDFSTIAGLTTFNFAHFIFLLVQGGPMLHSSYFDRCVVLQSAVVDRELILFSSSL